MRGRQWESQTKCGCDVLDVAQLGTVISRDVRDGHRRGTLRRVVLRGARRLIFVSLLQAVHVTAPHRFTVWAMPRGLRSSFTRSFPEESAGSRGFLHSCAGGSLHKLCSPCCVCPPIQWIPPLRPAGDWIGGGPSRSRSWTQFSLGLWASLRYPYFVYSRFTGGVHRRPADIIELFHCKIFYRDALRGSSTLCLPLGFLSRQLASLFH